MAAKMIVKRVFNNNVAMATASDGSEVIVMGRGLCFGRHAGDELEASAIEKTFVLARDTVGDEGAMERLARLLDSIPAVYLAISEDIVQMLRQELDPGIDDGILMALADHISLALEREKKGVPCDNPLLMEIKQFYRKEFALAKRAAAIIHDYLDIWISEEEVGFITLHIVNSTMRQRADRLVISVKLVRDVLAIVSREYATTLDETSLSYERFLRHLQFFAQRALDPEAGQVSDDQLFSIEARHYPKAFACADTIAAHLSSQYGIKVTDAEKSYLAYHIVNLLGEPGPQDKK